jgi:transposase
VRVRDEERVCGCGNEKQFVRYDSKHLLHYVPAVFEVEIQKREVLACQKGCKKSIVTAPVIPQILPKARATESLLAYISISKVLDRQPLYHLEKKIEREHHFHIPRKIMSRWMILMADKLQPLVNLMKEELLNYDVAAIDATTLQVLKEPKRKAETKSQAYCIRGGPPGKEVTIYEYNGYRQQNYVTELFTDYTGVISSDASPVFNGIEAKKGITLSYCHAHPRRKFEAIETMRRRGEKKAKKGLAFYVLKGVYKPLYEIEADMKDLALSPDEVYAYRQKKAKPLLEAHKIWLDKHVDLTPGQSPIRKAIQYSLNQWEGLMSYLEDGRVPIDNNATERDIKPFVIARKNFMFATTQAGADALGIHFTLIISAKHHGLDPMAYYTFILKEIPLCKTFDDYEKLLPWNVHL